MSNAKAKFTRLLRESVALDRSQLRWGWAIRNAIGIGITFVIGFASGHSDWALYMSLGAFVTGLGDIGRNAKRRAMTMLACTAAAAISTLVGALTAGSDGLAVLAMTIWGFGFGLMFALGPIESMIGRLAALALILVGDNPASVGKAFEIAATVAVGGLLQTALAMIPTKIATTDESPVPRGQRWQEIRKACATDTIIRRHAIRMALGLAFGVALYRFEPIGHGLWIPLTVLFVLQPDPHQTDAKVVERIIGTFAGVIIVTALVTATDPSVELMAVFATLFSVPMYAFLRPNYALFSGAIAAFVVLLVSIGGEPEHSVAMYRAIDTVIGAAIAVAVTFSIRMPRKRVAAAKAAT